ncbi:MAG: hypothetical protein AAF125_18880 [Chloroflexota bacterium]
MNRFRFFAPLFPVTLLAIAVAASAQSKPALQPFFNACADALSEVPKDDESTPVFEVTRFRLIEDADVESFLAAAAAVEVVLNKTDGFVCRQLLANANGDWVDLVYWTSQEKAEAAVAGMEQVIMSDEVLMPFFLLIDPESIDLQHYQAQ